MNEQEQLQRLNEMYREACVALGESQVTIRLLSQRLAFLEAQLEAQVDADTPGADDLKEDAATGM